MPTQAKAAGRPNPLKLKRIFSTFSAASELSLRFIDVQGEELTPPSGLTGFCQGCPELTGCRGQVRQLAHSAAQRQAPLLVFCSMPSLGCAAVPIMQSGRCLGSFVLSPLRMEAVKDDSATLPWHTVFSQADAETSQRKLPLGETANLKLLEFVASLGELLLEDETGPATVKAAATGQAGLIATENELAQAASGGHASPLPGSLGAKTAEAETFRLENMPPIQMHFDHLGPFLGQFMDSCLTSTFVSDFQTGEILMANSAFCRFMDLPLESVTGKKCWELHTQDRDSFCPDCPRDRLLDAQGKPCAPYSWDFYHAGRERWLRCTNQLITCQDGRLAHLVTQIDITNEKKLNRELESLAFYDRQTGLPNADRLLYDLRKDIEKGALWGNPPATPHDGGEAGLLCLELTTMSDFREAYGAETSADLLRAIVDWLLAHQLRGGGLYRLDGYKFCLLCRQSGEDELRQHAQSISARFAHSWVTSQGGHDNSYYCSVAQAIMFASSDLASGDELPAQMENILKMAVTGKQLVLLDSQLEESNRELARLKLSLENCVSNGMRGFDVHFQPIVEVSSGTWKGLEALCRWNSPELGPISPGVFIREAERSGLVSVLGNWVLSTAVSHVKSLQLDEIEGFFLSVNVSPIQLMDEHFADNVRAILQSRNYPGDKLSLEVTESTELSFCTLTMQAVENLRGLGIRLALDDFGTGYSSFNSLKNLPVQFLKTESSFTGDIENDNGLQYYFYVMSELSHANGIKLIAEGVESAEQFRIIKNNGADYIQGYFFSRPLSFAQLADRLENFVRAGEAFSNSAPEPMNLNRWLAGNNAYEMTPKLFILLHKCMMALSGSTDLDKAIYKVLAAVGEHFQVGRVVAYMAGKSKHYRNEHHWTAPGQNMKGLRPGRAHRVIVELLRNSGQIICKNTSCLPGMLSRRLSKRGVESLALLPIWIGNDIRGFVGFEHSLPRQWSPEEMVMLWNLSMILPMVINRQALQLEVNEKDRLLSDILNSTGLSLIVSDLETNEILWVNDFVKNNYKIGPYLLGRKCYEVIQGFSERCPFCRIPYMLENPHLGQIRFEHHNDYWNRDFIVYNSIMEWEGRPAHLEYSLDITRYKAIENQFEELHTTDRQTGVLNRMAALEKLRESAFEAQCAATGLTVAYVDINSLKLINLREGDQLGDQAILQVSQALLSCCRENDFIGRISGDEFLMVMPGCNREDARERLAKAAQRLRETPFAFGSVGFSFGLAEFDEHALTESDPGAANYPSALLSLAEERMEKQRRLGNIRVA